jgi:hypothetical protein
MVANPHDSGLILLLLGLCGLVQWLSWVPNWLHAFGICAVLSAFAILLVKGRWINRCACPGCGAWLRRPPDATDFICPACQVIWWTRARGESFWDWGA